METPTVALAPTYDLPTYEAANRILRYLERNIVADWMTVLRSVLDSQDEVARTVSNLRGSNVLGALASGTGSLRTAVEGPDAGEASQKAIALLKAEGHIIQIGQGRGKAILVTKLDRITPDGQGPETAPAAESEAVMATEIAMPDAVLEALLTIRDGLNQLIEHYPKG